MELDNNLLAELLFPNVKDSIEDLENVIPKGRSPRARA